MTKQTEEWTVGNPIDQENAGGNYPSWKTVREHYWMTVANKPSENYSPQNLGRMRLGKGPQVRIIARMRKTGEEVEKLVTKELHHIRGRGGEKPHAYDNLQEVWPWKHEAIDPFRHLGYDFVRFKSKRK